MKTIEEVEVALRDAAIQVRLEGKYKIAAGYSRSPMTGMCCIMGCYLERHRLPGFFMDVAEPLGITNDDVECISCGFECAHQDNFNPMRYWREPTERRIALLMLGRKLGLEFREDL